MLKEKHTNTEETTMFYIDPHQLAYWTRRYIPC
jgi:hypothetical protein